MDLTWVLRRPVLKAKVNQQINYNEQWVNQSCQKDKTARRQEPYVKSSNK